MHRPLAGFIVCALLFGIAFEINAILYTSPPLPPLFSSAKEETTASATPPLSTAVISTGKTVEKPSLKTENKEITAKPIPPPPSPAPPAPAPEPFSFNTLNLETRAALINILCKADTRSPVAGTSGSGIIIDPRGVILTGAHIAQYFLIQDHVPPGSLDCVIRTGSPAVPRYHAKLLYISPEWVRANYKTLSEENPRGTGEYDYGLLVITDSTSGADLPSSFPFLSIGDSDAEITQGTTILAAGYPAEFLSGTTIERDLYALTTVVPVSKVYTFLADTIDVFAFDGSLISEKGSSGGPIVSPQGHVGGLIVTSTQGETTGVRTTHAITSSYINRAFKASTGKSITDLLNSDLRTTAENFAVSFESELANLILSSL